MNVECAICQKPFTGQLKKTAAEFNKAAEAKGMRGAICRDCFSTLYPIDAKEVKKELGN